MRNKNLKKMSFMMSVVIALTGWLFPVTSSARDSEKGDIVFNDAKLKEVDLSSAFKTAFNISDSIEKAKFAEIDDGSPMYFTVTKVNNDNTRTPLELKSDADGKVCTEIVYPEKGINELPYEVIAVDSKLAPIDTKLGILYSNESDSRLVFNNGLASLSYYHFYFYDAVDYLELNKIDKGVPGKIRIDTYMEQSPFKSISYKTSKDDQFKELSFNGRSSAYIDLKSKYFAFKYEIKDEYYAFNYQRLIDGDSVDIGDIDEGQYVIEIDDITKDAPESTDPLNEFGYRLLVHCQSYDSGVSYPKNISGKVDSSLNTSSGTDKISDVVIDGLTFKEGKLRLYGARSGVTPCNLTVKGINKVEYLVFDTTVTITCEPGASLTFDHFSNEEPDPKEPKPVFEYKLGENTVYDKASKMFKYVAAPTPVPTATATPVPTAEPTVVADPTATPTTASDDATATPTATPTEDPASEPSDGAVAPAIQAVKIKKDVYFIENGKSATLSSADLKAKNVTVPATIKSNGKIYKVTKIAKDAFKGSKAQTITLGKNITAIDPGAFNNCSKLTTLVINSNIKELKTGTIKKCKKLKVLKIKSKKLSSVDKKAFSGCKVKTLKVYVNKKVFKKISPKIIKAGIKKTNILKL